MSRPLFSAATCVLAIGAVAPFAAAQDARPNIVIIATDDLRADTIGAYGHPFSNTPNIDSLANMGVRFDSSYATTPLCSPWRASFLTGQYMSAHGWTGNDSHVARAPNLDDATMWHELLNVAGYRTGYVGKYHLDTTMGSSNPDNRFGEPRPGWDYWAGFNTGQGTHQNVQLNVNGTVVNTTGYTTQTVTSYANSFLSSGSAAEPFALVVSYKAVHAPTTDPNDVTPANRNLYSTAQVQAHLDTFPQNNYDQAILDANKPILTRSGGPSGGNPIPGQTGPSNDAIVGQLRMLKDVDDGVGEILAQLQAQGVLNNTIVAFTSDSGEGWREHGLGGKSLPYEFSTRTPMIMYFPGAAAGQVANQFVTNIDIGPTLLSAAGVAVPSSMQGRSMIPLINGSGDTGRDVLYLEQYYDGNSTVTNSWQSVQDHRYKYIHYADYNAVDELYDTQADPYEIYNVISNAGYASELKRMKRELQLGRGAALTPGESRPVYAQPTSFNDFTLDENGAAINNNGSGSTNRVGALTNRGGGRNVFFMVELPDLADGETIAEASFQFLLTNNTGNAPAGLGGDLWALGIFDDDTQSRVLGAFLESETDADAAHVKIADDLLSAGTLEDQIIRTDGLASDVLAALLNDFYASHPDYEGGSYIHLRLNPDQNLGLINVGWDLAPVENIAHAGDPLMTITVVPEPASLALLAVSGLAITRRRRR